MRFARSVFLVAGSTGLVVLLPQYFMEARIGREYPPSITHPENFYGFVGVAAAWQVAFLVLATDPRRFRPMMIPAVLEKLSFGIATVALYLGRRIPPILLGFGLVDLAFAVLFVIAYLRVGRGLD